ncbi:3-hydroxyacyl-CoA dehydrogenase family protein [Hymenobacter sp. HDW8]|uniref:3-hydroxyacyl-CoA dehydrogenase family protein n=1 Tax=Hymenobacter sp. HDW8 TaxID=2714932 RepID=UPI00140D18C7|nr:3-hydroxyacyl-CoA dehydrogenase family protein [Hymenobacter sp. HDW8]QIL76451.1 3-hydroxyacyl-CoA dehydrogenase [Hymenobacter sp. HDW8]
MHLLIIDGNHVEAEFRQKFGPTHEYTFIDTENGPERDWEEIQHIIDAAAVSADVAFTFCIPSDRYGVTRWLEEFTFPIFAEVLWNSLADSQWEDENGKPHKLYFGFCGLPTLLNRPLLEVSLYNEADANKLAEICAALGTGYRVVQDRVGLVTPRVICMIINEACYTLQEGTASIQDIDKSMKLGTSYPRGPFEWANLIGVSRVYAVLEAMWQDTHDERYKVCPLLKTMYLRGESFTL